MTVSIKSLYLVDGAAAIDSETIERMPESLRSTVNPQASWTEIPKFGPNCGRKRVPNPALMRANPTHSHGTKMASIFRDAAGTMEGFETPSRNSTSSDRKFHVPISYARTTPFGNKNSRYTGDFGVEKSLGFKSDPRSLCETPTSPKTTQHSKLRHSSTVEEIKLKIERWKLEREKEECKRQLRKPITGDLDHDPSKIQYPQISKANPQVVPSSTSSIASDCHSSHGVPLVIPLQDRSENKKNLLDSWLKAEDKKSVIDSWLTEVVSRVKSNLPVDISSRHDMISEKKRRTNVYPALPPQSSTVHPDVVSGPFGKAAETIKALGELSNNKENAPPKNKSFRDLTSYQSPLLPSPSLKLSPPRLYSALSPSPSSPLSRSPQRITKAPLSENRIYKVRSPATTPFTIHEDNWPSDLSPLSANVELHRKGRSPRRERCASYWDDDLQIGVRAGEGKAKAKGRAGRSDGVGNEDEEVERKKDDDDDDGDGRSSPGEMRKGKKVLGVSAHSEKWTREKPFVEQAEGAPFRFNARAWVEKVKATGDYSWRNVGEGKY